MDPHNPLIEKTSMDLQVKTDLHRIRKNAISAALEALAAATASNVPMGDLITAQRQINAAIVATAALDPEEAELMVRSTR